MPPNLFTNERKRLVIIDGAEALILNAHVERVAHTRDLIDRLQDTGEHTSPILPSGCRMYATTRSYKFYVVERPPVQFNCRFQNIYNHIENREFPIWIPWQIYLIRVNQDGRYAGHMWAWMKNSLRSRDTQLFTAALPNEYTNGNSCMGSGTGAITECGSDIERMSQAIISHYRNSSFNSDLDHELRTHGSKDIFGHAAPPEYEGLKFADMREITCTSYIYKLWHWSQTQLNPRIDVCNLEYFSLGSFGPIFDAFKAGNRG